MNILSFISDKIIAVLVAVVLLLLAVIGGQYYHYDKQKTEYQLQIEQADRHIDNITAEYEHNLDMLNQSALQRQNELLTQARKKELAYSEKLAKLQKEKQQNEKRISSLNSELAKSNDSLQSITQRASDLAKKAISSDRKCLSETTASTKNQPSITRERLPERVIEVGQEMANDYRKFAGKVTSDYARLQGECRALQGAFE